MRTLPSSISTLWSLPSLQVFLAEHTPVPLPKADADKFQRDFDFSGTERPGDGSVGNSPAIIHGCTLPRPLKGDSTVPHAPASQPGSKTRRYISL